MELMAIKYSLKVFVKWLILYTNPSRVCCTLHFPKPLKRADAR